MKKQYDLALAVDSFNPEPLNTPAKARVRYVGFEGIAGCVPLNLR